MPVLLGAIADDFHRRDGPLQHAGAGKAGCGLVQLIDVPRDGAPVPDAEAVVVALKSRTIPADDAVAMSLKALKWLQAAGARQILFKYCSTFDLDGARQYRPGGRGAAGCTLGSDFTLYCPAFPAAGRTIFKGYLFVGDVLLSESGMKDHPLTPMRDPSLVRVLQRQSRGKVGLVPHTTVAQGPATIAEAFARLKRDGFRHTIVDAIADRDLEAIGAAAAGFPADHRRVGDRARPPGEFPAQVVAASGWRGAALPRIEVGRRRSFPARARPRRRAGRAYARARCGLRCRPDRGRGRKAGRRRGARLGEAAARRQAARSFGDGGAGPGRGGAGAARARASRGAGRGDAGGDREGAGRGGRAAARRRRRRDGRGGRPGARRHRAQDRRADRSRRAVDREPRQPAGWRSRSNPGISGRPTFSCAVFDVLEGASA